MLTPRQDTEVRQGHAKIDKVKKKIFQDKEKNEIKSMITLSWYEN